MGSDSRSPLSQAEAAASVGDITQVSTLARNMVSAVHSDEERRRWALVCASVGDLDQAKHWVNEVKGPTLHAALQAMLGEDPVLAAQADEAADDGDVDLGSLDRGGERSSEREARIVLVRFLEFFGGRRNLYARQWYNVAKRRGGYRPVREPLTEDVVSEHLAGALTIGQYLLWPDSSVSFAVIDLDLAADTMAALQASTGKQVSSLRHEPLAAYTRRLLAAGASLGLPLFAEDSGRRGTHLWIFFEPRRSARAARAILSQIVVAAGSQPQEISVELFPKQNALGPRKLSSLVKLPLGVHRETLSPCRILDNDLEPITNTNQALASLQTADTGAIDAILARRIVPLGIASETPALGLRERGANGGSDGEASNSEIPRPILSLAKPKSLGSVLRAIDTGSKQDEACENILGGCAVLSSIVAKGYETRNLESDERRAIAYTLGLVGERCELARDLFASTTTSFKELDRAERGTPAPTGCKRLAAMAVPKTLCHDCALPADSLPYRTPMLFAIGGYQPPKQVPSALGDWIDDNDVVPGRGALLQSIADGLSRVERSLLRLEDSKTSEKEGS